MTKKEANLNLQKASPLIKLVFRYVLIINFFFFLFPGYGHSTPNTIGGKLFTMCYAIVGIPLGLVMFQSIGERLNKFSSVVIRNVKKLLRCKDVDASEINLICVVTTLSSLTIAGGAAAFSRYEGRLLINGGKKKFNTPDSPFN